MTQFQQSSLRPLHPGIQSYIGIQPPLLGTRLPLGQSHSWVQRQLSRFRPLATLSRFADQRLSRSILPTFNDSIGGMSDGDDLGSTRVEPAQTSASIEPSQPEFQLLPTHIQLVEESSLDAPVIDSKKPAKSQKKRTTTQTTPRSNSQKAVARKTPKKTTPTAVEIDAGRASQRLQHSETTAPLESVLLDDSGVQGQRLDMFPSELDRAIQPSESSIPGQQTSSLMHPIVDTSALNTSAIGQQNSKHQHLADSESSTSPNALENPQISRTTQPQSQSKPSEQFSLSTALENITPRLVERSLEHSTQTDSEPQETRPLDFDEQPNPTEIDQSLLDPRTFLSPNRDLSQQTPAPLESQAIDSLEVQPRSESSSFKEPRKTRSKKRLSSEIVQNNLPADSMSAERNAEGTAPPALDNLLQPTVLDTIRDAVPFRLSTSHPEPIQSTLQIPTTEINSKEIESIEADSFNVLVEGAEPKQISAPEPEYFRETVVPRVASSSEPSIQASPDNQAATLETTIEPKRAEASRSHEQKPTIQSSRQPEFLSQTSLNLDESTPRGQQHLEIIEENTILSQPNLVQYPIKNKLQQIRSETNSKSPKMEDLGGEDLSHPQIDLVQDDSIVSRKIRNETNSKSPEMEDLGGEDLSHPQIDLVQDDSVVSREIRSETNSKSPNMGDLGGEDLSHSQIDLVQDDSIVSRIETINPDENSHDHQDLEDFQPSNRPDADSDRSLLSENARLPTIAEPANRQDHQSSPAKTLRNTSIQAFSSPDVEETQPLDTPSAELKHMISPDEIQPQGFAVGGEVKHSTASSQSPIASSDTVPALLTPGEFVIQATAAQAHLDLLQHINTGGNLDRLLEPPAPAETPEPTIIQRTIAHGSLPKIAQTLSPHFQRAISAKRNSQEIAEPLLFSTDRSELSQISASTAQSVQTTYAPTPLIFRKPHPVPTTTPDQWSSIEDLLSSQTANATAVNSNPANHQPSVLPVASSFTDRSRSLSSEFSQGGAIAPTSMNAMGSASSPTIVQTLKSPSLPETTASNHLDTLAKEVYQRLRQRLEHERERRGGYAGRLPW